MGKTEIGEKDFGKDDSGKTTVWEKPILGKIDLGKSGHGKTDLWPKWTIENPWNSMESMENPLKIYGVFGGLLIKKTFF